MRRFLAALAVLAGFGSLLYGTARCSLHAECEACVELGGQTVCRSAMAATRQYAAGSALSNACSIVTRTPESRRQCMETQAESLRCREF